MNKTLKVFCLFALLLFGCADLERNKFYEGDDDGGVVGGVDGSSSSGQNPGSSAQGSQGSSSSVRSSSSLAQGSQSSSSPVGYTGSYGSLDYEGKTYKTVVIGTQTWMAENLNYNVSGSKCYDNNPANCNTYGSLYTWSVAMALPSSCNDISCANQIQSPHRGICPSGWHIPGSEDWGRLSRYVDGTSGTFAGYVSSTAGRYLKSTSGWNSNSNGTDEHGFTALPGGRGSFDGSFGNVGNYGLWWSASESEDQSYFAYLRGIYDNGDDAYWYDNFKDGFYSVRCIKDSGGNSSSSSSLAPSSSSSVDPHGTVTHGDQIYETIVIGTQTWMAENLNYNVSGSKCYGDDPDNCEQYGRLYDWSMAMMLPASCNTSTCSGQIQSPHQGICPDGWHIPSDAEWDVLMTAVGGSITAGTKLKAASGWNSNGNGTNDYGFSALPGGYGYSSGFDYAGDHGEWWSATANGSRTVYSRSMYYADEYAVRLGGTKVSLYSVRCIKDN